MAVLADPLPKFLQVEEEVSQECRDIISSLPREEGWLSSHLYQYQGCWRTARMIQGIIAFQKHFQAHDTDIILSTTPKSGTTWLKAMLYSILNRNTYPDFQKHPLLTNTPHDLIPFLEAKYQGVVGGSNGVTLPELSSTSTPRLLFNHLPYSLLPRSLKESACKIVFLCRNPKDNFVSLWHFANKIRPKDWNRLPLEEAFDKFRRGVSPSGPFWDHVLGYWLESLEKPERVMFLRYEEVKDQPHAVLKRLADFVGCSFSLEEEANGVIDDILNLCSFDNLSNLEVNQKGELHVGIKNETFFRRGEVGDWVNYLTPEMSDKLDSITQQKLAIHGLKF